MSAIDPQKKNEAPGRDTKDAYSEMASDFAQLREDLAALKHDFVALTSAGAKDAKGALKEGITGAEAHARDAVDATTSEMQEIQKQAEKAVRKNPLTAVAGALAIGYFLAGLRK